MPYRKTLHILFSLIPLGMFSQGTWTQKTNFGGIARQEAAGFTIGNKAYIGTGWNGAGSCLQDFWEWDPSTNIWTQKANFGGGNRQGTYHFSIGTKGYIAMGWNCTTEVNDLWEWDQVTNVWTQKANFPSTPIQDGSSFSIGTKGYIGTGYHSSTNIAYNVLWEWNQTTNTWTQMTNFGGIARIGTTCRFSIGTKGYIGLGSNASFTTFYNDFWEWDQTTNVWTQKANFGGTARAYSSGFSICTRGYIGTGYDGTLYNQDFWQWDQTTNVWTQVANLGGVGRFAAVGFSLNTNGKGYIGTGSPGSFSGIFLNDFWEYTPPPCNTMSVTATSQNILCNSQCTGSSTVNPSNGTPPYTYNWNNGQTTQTATGLCAGNYSVLVTDASSATITATVMITQPATALSAITSATSATCLNNNGSATITASGGTPAYSYSWNPSGQTNQTATGLVAGNYSVIVSDANGCTKTQTVSVTANNPLTVSASFIHSGCAVNNATAIPNNGTAPYTYAWNPGGQTTQTATGLPTGIYTVTVTDALGCISANTITISSPLPLAHSFPAVINVNCFGNNNGIASVNVSGGTPSYTYLWNSIPTQTTQIATGLLAGTYTITVTDSLGCIFSDTVVISSPLPLSHSFNAANVDCFGNNNGSAGTNVLGGTPSYTYSWSSIPVQTTQTITGLYAGVYTVTLTDSHGCALSDTVVIKSPTGLTVFSPVISNVLCFGGSTGLATVTVTGGTPGYSYSWNPTAQTASTATELAVGVYTITITDNNGCIINTLVPVTQPPLLTASSSQTNILCFGNSTGSATINVSGGTPGYTYLWNPSSATTATATSLSSGTYTILASDANGCTFDTTVTLIQPIAPLSSLISSVNVLCNPDSTGSATATVSGGTSGYTYLWMPGVQTTQSTSNLVAGTYSLTFSDANGCSDTSSIIITQPPLLAATISSDTTICSGTNAADSVMVSGGTPGYTYSWLPGGETTSAIIISPPATATYTAHVTDAHGCSTSQLITTIIVQPTPTAAFLSSLDKCTRCLQLTDQSVNAVTWLWNFGDNDTSSQQNPVHCFSGEGVYTISLTVNSSPQCKNIFSLPDSVFGYEFAPAIPNVFTPNGDGMNDVFSITGLDKCSPYFLKIYDRWGVLLFETEKTKFLWDGRTSAGIPVQEGTYYYILFNNNTTKKGFVTLLR